jgi:hypothetical protein
MILLPAIMCSQSWHCEVQGVYFAKVLDGTSRGCVTNATFPMNNIPLTHRNNRIIVWGTAEGVERGFSGAVSED